MMQFAKTMLNHYSFLEITRYIWVFRSIKETIIEYLYIMEEKSESYLSKTMSVWKLKQ